MSNAETEVYLIRHGSVENPKRMIYGKLPGFHLSKKGEQEVRKIAEILKSMGIRFDAVYTSPLERAVETAQIISGAVGSSNVETREELTEIGIPSFQGNIKPIFFLKTRIFVGSGAEFDDPETEPIHDIIKRVSGFLGEVRQKHKGQKVALVSHGHPTRLLLWYLQHPSGELPEPHKLRDNDYLAKGEVCVLYFDQNDQFSGYRHIRRRSEHLRDID